MQTEFIGRISIKAIIQYSLILLSYSCLSLEAQHLKPTNDSKNRSFQNIATVSESKITECSGLVIPDMDNIPFLTNLKNLEKKHTFRADVDLIKKQKTISKKNNLDGLRINESNHSQATLNLTVATNFQGNVFNGGAPPDNTIAISNNGYIVSVINCNVAYFNSNGNQLWTGSFWELFNDPTLTELIYDPIVVYDSEADRFVMIAIHGFSSATSKLIVCFSKTNNPTDGWWIYKLTGNPLNNACWLDYPKLGISNNEIFVTGNLFNDITGYSESVIYQIGKSKGYSGTNLNWVLWSNIAGSPITIIPASYGQQGNYGPGLYFVSQSPVSGNSVDLYEITDSIGGNSQLTRNTIFKSDYETSGI